MPEYTLTQTDGGSIKVQCRGDETVDSYCKALAKFMKDQKLNVLFWPTVYFSTPETKRNKPNPIYSKKKPIKKMTQKQVDKACKEFETKGAPAKYDSVITDDDLPWVA